ncbi:hypothetical protein DIP10_09570 [Neisseria gonorrhoeae]|nr:hypothetical protein EGH15_00285 [Neisseria gonorrhoeae]AZG26367.1 hypothetical protein EGH18_00280 [Neisseria gonorrhoeae]AZG43226.1 hypothetical protein EGH11_00280 [Neisseria gonorrhoeae]RZN63667.1 hypothetical protein EHJ43_11400 [Neisseria gonorrhoeae]
MKSTVANLSYFSNHRQPKNLPKPTPSPVGEGWGEGILRMVAIFPNTFAAQIQALRLVALSPALSHRERGRVGCWG